VGLGLNDIEMDSVTPSGHRRRRSSLINPANASNSRHRSRSLSTRRPANADDEDKIVEESSDDESLRPGEVDEDELTDEDLHDDEEAGLTGKDRRRKRRKRRRNQLLDQRIARDDGISPEEKQEADRTVVRSLVINGVLIGLWYFFSLLISLVWTSTLTFLVF
jgi:solute carrier family 35 protein C2